MKINLPEVAEAVYASYIEESLANKSETRGYQDSVLVALGYGNWLLPGDAWLDTDTPSRRRKVLSAISGYEWGPAASAALNAIWYGTIPPANKDSIPRRVDWTKSYCRISDDTVFWGLEETQGRDVLFQWKYDHVYLRVLDGKDVISERSSYEFDNIVTLAELGCDDDDYRFEVGYEGREFLLGRIVPRGGTYFDFAKVDGVWQPLPWSETGHDWSGEWTGNSIPSATEDESISDNDKKEDEQSGDVLLNKVLTLAAQIQHGPSHVERWQSAARALGYNDFQNVSPMTLEEARKCAEQYSSPLWPQVVAVIEGKGKRQMSDAQKTKRQEQIENTRKQEAERLRVLATKMEEELLDIHGEVPSPELMWQMIRRMGLELDDVKDTLDEKLVSAWLQWWRERHVFVQRALLFMPFLIVFEGLDLVRLISI